MKTDLKSDTKTRMRKADVAAHRGLSGDSCFATAVDPDPMCLARFGGDSTGSSSQG